MTDRDTIISCVGKRLVAFTCIPFPATRPPDHTSCMVVNLDGHFYDQISLLKCMWRIIFEKDYVDLATMRKCLRLESERDTAILFLEMNKGGGDLVTKSDFVHFVRCHFAMPGDVNDFFHVYKITNVTLPPRLTRHPLDSSYCTTVCTLS